MSAISKALVVGGGIGGLTAAAALGQRGIEVELIEIRGDLSVYGVGIIQPNNTLRALSRIGLAQACLDAGAAYPGVRLHDASGTVLAELGGSNSAAPDYPPTNGITRPKLHEILTRAAKDAGATIRLGESIEAIADDGAGVDVTFKSGKRATYDLVVGADGVNSDLRARLFGSDLRPQSTGQGVWRYNLPRPADLTWGEAYFGPSSKVGFVPLSTSLMYILVVTSAHDAPGRGVSGTARAMREHLRDYGGRVAQQRDLIVDDSAVVYRSLETLILPAPWMKGRILLIGDAAHSTTPHLAQGAALAIEDAVLLGELMSREAAVPELLAEFMRRRFDRAKFIVDSSLQIGVWELEEWQGTHNPSADPAALVHRAGLAMMEDY